jgi:eukaryotic-like serine/threonine-protein kinase
LGDGASVAAARDERGGRKVTPERWQEIKPILAGALERPPGDRSAYLKEACADSDMRREVDSLLAANGDGDDDGFLAPITRTPWKELSSGSKIGAYEIVSRIGAGGMGEVYQARDSALGRSVAIKVLPPDFAADSERLLRFQQEARILASLNHPNIATIYGLEQSDGKPYLVMEFIPGESLAHRLEGGALSLPDAMDVASQIASALESAHERGIVHRDVKPGNILLMPDGRVKVVDFGLSKALATGLESMTREASPNVAASLPGTLIGTPAYMSPEQVRAKPVDKRADIWAFGCVLYEMLSGHRAFGGENISEILVAILTKEPNWNQIQARTPGAIRTLVQRCLIKESSQRLRDIGEARIAIEDAPGGRAESGAVIQQDAPTSKSRWWLYAAMALAAVAIFEFALLHASYFRPRPAAEMVRFNIDAPDSMAFNVDGGQQALSPDGRKLAFISGGPKNGALRLWVRSLDSLTFQEFPEAKEPTFPFWSPDGKYIGYFSQDGTLETIPVAGGAPEPLCEAKHPAGGTWNRNGEILFSSENKLFKVSEAGGARTLVSAPDRSGKEIFFHFPQFLPDGNHFLFYVLAGDIANIGPSYVAVGALDSPMYDLLFETNSAAQYAPPGYLLSVSKGSLLARPFNLGRMKVTGEPRPLVSSVGVREWKDDLGFFSVSQSGVLSYRLAASGLAQMTWYNRR